MRTRGVVALVAAVGLAGFVVGRSTAPTSDVAAPTVVTATRDGTRPDTGAAPHPARQPRAPDDRPDAPATAPRRRARNADPLPQPRPPEPPRGNVAHTDVQATLVAPADEATIAARLREAVGADVPPARVADVRRRSEALREAGLHAANSSDRTALREVADEVVRERAFLADQARGGLIDILRRITPGTRLLDLASDAAAFERHFARHENGPVIDVTQAPPRPPLAHGTTLTFPAGAHVWDVRGAGGQREFPRDLLVQGAGMDSTLLRLNELSANGEVVNLTFRDLTIDCGDDYLTDLRGDVPITLRLERCRVVAFDMGAGGSVMLSASRAAFLATDCRFEAGYGRTQPGFGNLFSVGRGLLARLERCTFVGPFSSVVDANASAAYAFTSCAFTRMRPGFERTLEPVTGGVRLTDCVFTEPLANDERPARRSLSDLNPAWPSRR